jgi:hypothetical protein
MASVLRVIRQASYPAPPSAALFRHWLSITEDDVGRARGVYLLNAMPTGLLMLFREAGSLRSEAHVGQFLAALPLIQQWLLTERPSIDRNQQRAGWPWLVSRSRRWLEAKRRSLVAAGVRGRVVTGPVSYGGYTAIPIGTGVELLELGLVLHNCLPSHLDYYLGPAKLMYRVEDGEGTVVAAIALDFNGRRWSCERVAGVANQAAPSAIQRLGKKLVDVAQQATGRTGPVEARHPLSHLDPDGGGDETPDLDEEESDVLQGCPYCNSREGCDHVLLSVDITFRESVGGPLYEWFRQSWYDAFDENGDSDEFDEGGAYDELLALVEAHADTTQYDEFSGAPGQSSAYRIFYCSSRERATAAALALKHTRLEADEGADVDPAHPLPQPATALAPTERKRTRRQPHLRRIRADGYRELLISRRWDMRGAHAEKSIRGARVMQTIVSKTQSHFVCRFQRKEDFWAAILRDQDERGGSL